jgi:hypothetical protein
MGFDHPWDKPVILLGGGKTEWRSDGEVARLSLQSRNSFRCSVTTSRDIPWNRSNQYIQIRYSRLSPEARLKIWILSDADNREPHLVYEQQSPTSAPLACKLVTIDLQHKIPEDTQHLGLRLELAKDNLREAPPEVEVYIDWIKAALESNDEANLKIENATGPGDNVVEDSRIKFEWTTAQGTAQAKGYTVALSRDPLFAGTIQTRLDSVTAAQFTTTQPLSSGKWYWTVSATGSAGESGDFYINKATGEPNSFIIASKPATKPKTFEHFPIRGGASGFGGLAKFTKEPMIVEQARYMLAMGNDAYKFLLGSDMDRANYLKCYTDMSPEARKRSKTLVELINNEPGYKTVLDLPFTYYVMWTYPMKEDLNFGKGGLTEKVLKTEYAQIYELTRYLLQTYQGSGKVFLIGHWEGDNMMTEAGHGDIPDQNTVDEITQWHRTRQAAVTAARASLPQVSGVEAYYYAEVNAITPVLEHNWPRMINSVLPNVPVDIVSYSAYNALNDTAEEPDRCYMHFDYIISHAKFTGQWKHSKPLFVGEYGLPLDPQPSRGPRNAVALKSAASWGSPINLYWSIFTQLQNNNSSVYRLDGSKTEEFYNLQSFAGQMHFLRNATRVWLNRNPTELEGNQLAWEFDSVAPHEILARILNSLEYCYMVNNEDFIKQLEQETGASLSSETAHDLLTRLQRNQICRFNALKEVLDSDAFSHAVSDANFQRYLAEHMAADAVAPPCPVELKKRSERYVWALDQDAFRAKNIEYAHEVTVTPAIEATFKPHFAGNL